MRTQNSMLATHATVESTAATNGHQTSRPTQDRGQRTPGLTAHPGQRSKDTRPHGPPRTEVKDARPHDPPRTEVKGHQASWPTQDRGQRTPGLMAHPGQRSKDTRPHGPPRTEVKGHQASWPTQDRGQRTPGLMAHPGQRSKDTRPHGPLRTEVKAATLLCRSPCTASQLTLGYGKCRARFSAKEGRL